MNKILRQSDLAIRQYCSLFRSLTRALTCRRPTESASTGEIIVTNDGATILKSISLDNPAAKILVNISKVQDDEVGDGTTSVCVLASELLREGERLVNMKIHPQTIIEGYRIASKAALDALEAAAQDHGCVFHSETLF